jgi:glycosyltransferase involved in cell wall biosynthesis
VRIAYVITRADAVGGASVHVRDLARAMLDRGHEATVLVGGEGPVTEELGRAGVPYRPLRTLARPVRPVADLLAIRELTATLRDLRPNLISTHTAKAGWIGRAAGRLAGIPSIYTPHGWAITDRVSGAHGPAFALAERIAARWAGAIICVCRYERELALARRIAPASKLHVVHNGVRDIPEALHAEPERSPVRIASVARFEPPKDHATLLRALASLRSQPWELDLAGDGPAQGAARALAAELGIGGRIRFLGFQSDPTGVLAKARIFALSSRSEGFPRSVLEAMRAGLPVVATDVGGVAEAVEHGAAGLLAPRDDVRAMAAALAALLEDPGLRKRFGSAARLAYERKFRLEHMVKGTLAVYGTLLGSSKDSWETDR